MTKAPRQVKEWTNVDRNIFENTIVPAYQPAILKQYVKDWPIVKAAQNSLEDVKNYLLDRDLGKSVNIILADSVNERLSYNATVDGLNFKKKSATLNDFFQELPAFNHQAENKTAYLQSTYTSDIFRNVDKENTLDLFDPNVRPRIWVGNKTTVPPHYDNSENIACVACGHRRFTLFPPEQIKNLYVGPLDFTPAGASVSMVDVKNPDLEKFPRFTEALEHALVADLEPGDALYVPTIWWHNVEALDDFNILINYWSGGTLSGNREVSPAETMLMGLLTIKDLPEYQRRAWQEYFNHYVFQLNGDPVEHIPEKRRGVLGKMSLSMVIQLKNYLASQLKQK